MFLRNLPFRGFSIRNLPSVRCMYSSQSGNNQGSGKGPKDVADDDYVLGIPKDWDGKTETTDEKRKLRPPPPLDPVRRTHSILLNDLKKTPKYLGLIPMEKSDEIFPHHCDILIIGGGTMGSSVAYWLKEKAREGLRIVVVEKDPTVS